MKHLIRFVRILHRSNSDTFDPFYIRLDGFRHWARQLPAVFRILWEETK